MAECEATAPEWAAPGPSVELESGEMATVGVGVSILYEGEMAEGCGVHLGRLSGGLSLGVGRVGLVELPAKWARDEAEESGGARSASSPVRAWLSGTYMLWRCGSRVRWRRERSKRQLSLLPMTVLC